MNNQERIEEIRKHVKFAITTGIAAKAYHDDPMLIWNEADILLTRIDAMQKIVDATQKVVDAASRRI